ncbi:MAG: class I SAM-dependent methyltransferase, partial [Planctomycetales bacterium]|nr:class I SAM-dependent methyltransferase [Planctomycetales bacterium]
MRVLFAQPAAAPVAPVQAAPQAVRQSAVSGQGTLVPPAAPAQAAPLQRAASSPQPDPAIPPADKFYLGREIAQTMHFAGAPWLVRESRERQEECSTLMSALHFKPGQAVADLGCGNGFYTLKIAAKIAPGGRVLAVDIQPEMLQLLNERARVEKIAGVEPVLGTLIDPRLPEGKVDLILCVDAYHEFSHPQQMLAAIRKSLAPQGRLVLVEFRAEDPKVPIKPLHKMTKVQVNKELT